MTVALAVTSNSIAQPAQISPPDSALTGRPADAAAAPTPAIDPDWHSEAKGLGLQPAGVTRLSKQKFLITSRQFNQAFHPYANPQAIPNGGNFNDGNAQVSLPHFITSDAVLNAFHVVFEESIAQLERINASRMRAGLADLWKKLPAAGNAMVGQPARVAAARFRAQVLIGTALRLAGGETPDAPAGVEQAIQANLAFAIAAEASLQMPAGSGTPDATPAGYRGIDFTRLRPRGFYADGGRLAGYFQAVAWLQQVQLRLDHDDEVLAAHLIGSSLIEPTDQNRRDPATFLRQISTSFDSLLGPAAEPQVVTSALVAGSNRRGLVDLIFVPLDGRLDADKVLLLRSTFQESLDEWLTDRVWVSGERQRPPNAARSFRVLCARSVPEAAVLNATSAPPRYFPSGLDLLVALGSKRAETLGRGKDWPNVVDTAREAADDLLKPPPRHAHGPAEKRENVYREYLRALAALVQPVDADAPPFMKSTAWQTKQCQTALAGWAQMRHTWLLQAEDSASLFAGTPKRAGFVEPVPQFWSRLEHVVRLSHRLLKEQGALGEDVGNALLLEDWSTGSPCWSAPTFRAPARPAGMRFPSRSEAGWRTSVTTTRS